MSSFGKRSDPTALRSRSSSDAPLSAVAEVESFAPPALAARAESDWSARTCALITLVGVLGLVWAAAFAFYLFFDVSLDACKQYVKYASLLAPALVFIIVSNALIKRETLNQILIQICVVAAYGGANAVMMNWLLDDGEPREVTMNVAAKSRCASDVGAYCVQGRLPNAATALPALSGSAICAIPDKDYEQVVVGQSRMTVRVHPGRFNWEWQESGCDLQF